MFPAAAEKRLAAAEARLAACDLCPRRCGVNRLAGERGFCGAGRELAVASVFPHFGEEGPLVGRGGSGAVFLAGCGLRCLFCQNSDISHRVPPAARPADPADPFGAGALARRLVALQEAGCPNVNFVTPTHFAPQLMRAIHLARRQGLKVPVVYNCGGYESLEMLRLLEGFAEIYMPDAKFTRPASAAACCAAPDYPEAMRRALKEMHRQVGDLVVEGGLARRGLMVRHLVLPGGAGEGREVAEFLAREISPGTYLNVMDQYRPCFRAAGHRALGRYPEPAEIEEVARHAAGLGLRLDEPRFAFPAAGR